MSAVKVVRLYVVVKLPYIKANFSFNGISFHTKKYIYIYKGQNHEPNHVRQVNALPPLQFCTLSPHMVKIKLFNSWPPLTLQFSWHHSNLQDNGTLICHTSLWSNIRPAILAQS